MPTPRCAWLAQSLGAGLMSLVSMGALRKEKPVREGRILDLGGQEGQCKQTPAPT